MKNANSNPMGRASVGGTKPDGAVLRMMTAKLSSNLNTGNTKVPSAAKLNRPTAKSSATNPIAPARPPKPAAAKLNRKARTS